MIYRFGPFRADRVAYRVLRDDRPLDLTPKLLDVLFYLLDRPATLVTKEQLLDGVWPNANVTDNALAQAISELRDALGDAAAAPDYIKTVARRGYRFIAPVDVDEPSAAAPARSAAGSGAPRSIAVLDFTNVTGARDVDWLSAGIAETVSSDLAALDRFRVVDRWRVLQAVGHARGSMHEAGAALGLDLVATGSFQRSGSQLRISARIVDLESGEAIADAKVDGQLDDVFTLQDGIVSAFARELGIAPPPRGRAVAALETSNLEAYRAHTEGWLKLETFDTDLVPPAIADFERAIAADPEFAQAYTGLANAELVAYEMTRLLKAPDRAALASGIEHAQHAIRLHGELAEAHATLGFLLASAGRPEEAVAAARRAIAIEPGSWRHLYRLGHVTWGAERLRALERSLALYPQFPYARLEAAMVYVARRRFDIAEVLGRQGAAEQDRQARTGHRFPGVGFHWLLGALHAAAGRHQEAIVELNQELAHADARRLYGPEYAVAALFWRGHSELALGSADAALASFRKIHRHLPDHARGFLGEAIALRQLGDVKGSESARTHAAEARDLYTRTGRTSEALLLAAMEAAGCEAAGSAIGHLTKIVDDPHPGPGGWTVSIEPDFQAFIGTADFSVFLDRLALRAS